MCYERGLVLTYKWPIEDYKLMRFIGIYVFILYF